MKATRFMIFGREDSNGAWEAYGGSLAKRLDKELQEDLDRRSLQRGEERFFFMGRFGEEERQEDDYVLVVVLFLQTAWLVVEILRCAIDLVE